MLSLDFVWHIPSSTYCMIAFAVWLHSICWLVTTPHSLDVHLRRPIHKPIKRSFLVRWQAKRHASHLLCELIQSSPRTIRTSSPDRRTCGLACSERGVAPQECRRRSSGTYCTKDGAVRDVACRNNDCTACLTDSVCGWVGVAVVEESAEDENYRVESQAMHGSGVYLRFFSGDTVC